MRCGALRCVALRCSSASPDLTLLSHVAGLWATFIAFSFGFGAILYLLEMPFTHSKRPELSVMFKEAVMSAYKSFGGFLGVPGYSLYVSARMQPKRACVRMHMHAHSDFPQSA